MISVGSMWRSKSTGCEFKVVLVHGDMVVVQCMWQPWNRYQWPLSNLDGVWMVRV